MLFEVIVITSVRGKFSSDALEQCPYLWTWVYRLQPVLFLTSAACVFMSKK
jgi:hypothetical protein